MQFNMHTSGILYTWFMSVRTGTYRYVPTCTMLSYVPVRTTWKMSHDGTGRYIPVRTGTGKWQEVRTRTYSTAYKAVQGSTERYMSVQGGLHLRRAGRGGRARRGRPILVSFRNHCIDCTKSGFCFK